MGSSQACNDPVIFIFLILFLISLSGCLLLWKFTFLKNNLNATKFQYHVKLCRFMWRTKNSYPVVKNNVYDTTKK